MIFLFSLIHLLSLRFHIFFCINSMSEKVRVFVLSLHNFAHSRFLYWKFIIRRQAKTGLLLVFYAVLKASRSDHFIATECDCVSISMDFWYLSGVCNIESICLPFLMQYQPTMVAFQFFFFVFSFTSSFFGSFTAVL